MAMAFRIALRIHDEYISAWQRLMLERLQAYEQFSITTVIVQPVPATPVIQHLNRMLFTAVRKFDGLLFRCPVQAQLEQSALPLLGDVLMCQAGSLRYQQLLQQEPIDVVIDLTGQEVPDELAQWTRHGVWRYVFGNPVILNDQTAALREYAHSADSIFSGLERICAGSKQAEGIFYATTSTNPASVGRGIEHTLWKMVDFIPQRLVELSQVGEEQFSKNNQARQQAFPRVQRGEQQNLGLLNTLQIMVRYSYNMGLKLLRKIAETEQWVLLLGKPAVDGKPYALEQFQRLVPPADRFWADPFLLQHQGETYLFFEELIYERGIGHLACMRIYEDGTHSEPLPILERPYHLSYPFIFQHQGEYYMIPETAENHSIELYRCEEFPHKWIFEKNLMIGVEAYDSTLVEHEGHWWLFASMRQHQNTLPNEGLYLFYADSPLSEEWQPHVQNPVVASASHARPAGRIYAENGELFRPSQNCAGSYGRGLHINRILQLDPQVYREETIQSYQPDGEHDLNGVHTLDRVESLVVTDGVYVQRSGVLGRILAKQGGA